MRVKKDKNKKKIIIFKNDATGDLIHSREAIYNIINSNKNSMIKKSGLELFHAMLIDIWSSDF